MTTLGWYVIGLFAVAGLVSHGFVGMVISLAIFLVVLALATGCRRSMVGAGRGTR